MRAKELVPCTSMYRWLALGAAAPPFHMSSIRVRHTLQGWQRLVPRDREQQVSQRTTRRRPRSGDAFVVVCLVVQTPQMTSNCPCTVFGVLPEALQFSQVHVCAIAHIGFKKPTWPPNIAFVAFAGFVRGRILVEQILYAARSRRRLRDDAASARKQRERRTCLRSGVANGGRQRRAHGCHVPVAFDGRFLSGYPLL